LWFEDDDDDASETETDLSEDVYGEAEDFDDPLMDEFDEPEDGDDEDPGMVDKS